MYDPSNPFYNSYGLSSYGFFPLVEVYDMDSDIQSYFLSLPENEQLDILRESRGSTKNLYRCINERRHLD